MMALALGQRAERGDEVQRFLEVLEGKAPLDAAALVHERPAGRLLEIAFGLGFRQRRNPAAARRAGLRAQIVTHRSPFVERTTVRWPRSSLGSLQRFIRPARPRA